MTLLSLAGAARSRSRQGTTLLTAAAVAVTFVVARQVARGNPRGLHLIVGSVALAGVLARPRAAVLALLGLTCTLFIVPRGQIAVAGSHTDFAELLAGVLIVAFGWRELIVRNQPRAPVLGLGLLIGAVAVGCVWSATHGGERPSIVGDAKTYGLYLLLIPLNALFADERAKQQLERWILRIASGTSVAVLLAVATGYPLEGRPGTVIDLQDVAQVERVRPALLALLFLATLLLVSHILVRGWNALRAAGLMLFLAVWAVSFNRSSWTALAFACLLLAVFRRGPRRPKRLVISLLVASVLLPTVFVCSATGVLGRTAVGVANRLGTIGQGQTFSSGSSSFEDRAVEYNEAGRALTKSPVFGVGVGNVYGARRAVYDQRLQTLVYEDRRFSHNSLLYLYLQLGALGFLAFGVLAGQITRRCYRSVVQLPFAASTRAAAAGCALIGAGLESLANPNLLARASIVTLCLAVVLLTPPRDATELSESSELSEPPALSELPEQSALPR